MNVKDYKYKVTAAGRVNIIGEHVDYCGGKVIPAALSLKNTVYVRPNGTDKICLSWTSLPDKIVLDIDKLESYKSLKYGSYQAGSAYMWQKAGHTVTGCDMFMDCSIPFGSGLSSSAAIEVSTIAALVAVCGEKADPVEIAVTAQKAEREYVGVNCGIMDQYTSACGKKNKALLLDCNTLECEYLPLELGEYSFVIAGTNRRRSLTESKYNERRSETEEALKRLQSRLDVSCLAEITPSQFKTYSVMLPPVLKKRASHVINECERVRIAVEALKVGNLRLLGRLLNFSHASLKDDFEVTGKALDELVSAAQNHHACLGSRMIGAGFGGSTVSLVKTEAIDDFKQYVAQQYYRSTGFTADFYAADVSDGITVDKING